MTATSHWNLLKWRLLTKISKTIDLLNACHIDFMKTLNTIPKKENKTENISSTLYNTSKITKYWLFKLKFSWNYDTGTLNHVNKRIHVQLGERWVNNKLDLDLTRMHSSRMRTARLLTVSQYALSGGRCPCLGGVCTCRGCTCRGCTCPGGVPTWGCSCPGGYLPGGRTCPGGVPAQVLPPVNRMTDRQV